MSSASSSDAFRNEAEERLRADLLQAALAQAPALGAAAVPDLDELVDLYYANVAVDDLVDQDSLDILGAALSHRQTASHRAAGSDPRAGAHPDRRRERLEQRPHHASRSSPTTCRSWSTRCRRPCPRTAEGSTWSSTRSSTCTAMPPVPCLTIGPVDHGTSDDRHLEVVTESWIHFDIDRESDAGELEELASVLDQRAGRCPIRGRGLAADAGRGGADCRATVRRVVPGLRPDHSSTKRGTS